MKQLHFLPTVPGSSALWNPYHYRSCEGTCLLCHRCRGGKQSVILYFLFLT